MKFILAIQFTKKNMLCTLIMQIPLLFLLIVILSLKDNIKKI